MYSELASSLLATTRKIAKHHGTTYSSPVFFLAAVSQWAPKKFVDRYRGRTADLDLAMKEAAKTPRGDQELVDEFLHNELGRIANSADVWSSCDRLWETLTIAAPTEPPKASNPPSSPKAEDAPKSTSFLNEIPLADIAAQMKISDAEVETFLIRDFYFMTAKVMGSNTEDHAVREEAEHLTGRRVGDQEKANELSPLVGMLADSSAEGAPELAKTLAESYVRFSNKVALKDGILSPDELTQIDELRNELKGQLGRVAKTPRQKQHRFYGFLTDFVGLRDVKDELADFIKLREVDEVRRNHGLPTTSNTMHLAFLGRPGTGKTEVARQYAKALKEIGVLSKGQFVEVDRAHLVGTHVGETEKKTNAVIDSAVGGVLFIDEAYSLDDRYGSQKGFGEEALDVLVRRMENNRDNLVVILAGYADATKRMIDVNEGLRSRIALEINFSDYSIGELMEIFEGFVRRSGFSYGADVRNRVEMLLESRLESKDFANARDVRNLFEALRRRQSRRISDLGLLATIRDLSTFEVEDVPVYDPKVDAVSIGVYL